MKIGICGEHGGDPKSVEFCHEIGLDYVSCSPYRLPIARLAAAQAAIKERAAQASGAGTKAPRRKPARRAPRRVARSSAARRVARKR